MSSWETSRYTSPRYPDPDVDALTEPVLRLFAEPAHLPCDVQPGPHRAVEVVLVGDGVAEHSEEPIALDRCDVALVALDGACHQFAVLSDEHPVGLGCQPGGQLRRFDEIDEHECESSHLTGLVRSGEQILCVGVGVVYGQHLTRQSGCRLAVTAVERIHGPIEQIVDRRVAIISGVAAPRRLVVAHVNIVSSPPGLADGNLLLPIAQPVPGVARELASPAATGPRSARSPG